MRIVLQYETPELLKSLQAIVPDAEIVSLPPEASLNLASPVDVFLGTPSGGEQLAKLLEVSLTSVGFIF